MVRDLECRGWAAADNHEAVRVTTGEEGEAARRSDPAARPEIAGALVPVPSARWPRWALLRAFGTVGLRATVSAGAVAVLLPLLAWFDAELITPTGQADLAERISGAAGTVAARGGRVLLPRRPDGHGSSQTTTDVSRAAHADRLGIRN